MASERDKAKRAIQKTEPKDSELNETLADASDYQHLMAAENNRHKEAMHQADLGGIGRLLGGKENSPIAIAALVVVAGIIGVGLSGLAAWSSKTPESAEFGPR